MDMTFVTNIIASSAAMFGAYLYGMIQAALALGPYVLGLVVLSIFIGFIILILHWLGRIGRRGGRS